MNTAVAKVAQHPAGEDDEKVLSGLPAGYNEGNQSLAVSIARAEIDQQITTAHAFPRSVARAVKNILELATLDEETAKECIYALPRGGKPIKGPSIRLAEIIQSQWGNNRVGTRITHVDRIEKYVEAEGIFHDLENNSATTVRVKRRLSSRDGQLLNEDMIIVTGNAASSIARRNAILAGVPKAVWRQAYAAVERVLVGDVATMSVKREDALKAFAGFGVKPEQIYEVLQIEGLEDIGPDEYTTLVGMHQALRGGEATVEEMFPVKRPGQPPSGDKPKDLNSKLDTLAKGGKQKSETGSTPAGSGEVEKQDTPPKSTATTQKSSSPDASSGGDASQDSAQTRNHAPKTASADAASEKSLDSDAATNDEGETPFKKAQRQGRAAYRNDLTRKSNPYKDDLILSDGWLEGFEAAEKADAVDGGEG